MSLKPRPVIHRIDTVSLRDQANAIGPLQELFGSRQAKAECAARLPNLHAGYQSTPLHKRASTVLEMAATTWTWISRLIRNLATREEEAVRLGVQLKKMPDRYSIATLTRSSSRVIQWFLHLGGVGLILLGLLDGFLLPIFPGSMDIATIFLAAHDKKLWFYYAAMATAGSVLGGLLTYRLARKGGKEAFEKRFRGENVQTIYKRFERWGFAAIAVCALLPPPIPLFPVVVTAGATRYSVTKFLTALTLGRTVRYTILAFLAAHYGGQILTVISRHGYVVLFAAVGLVVLGVVLFFLVRQHKRKMGTA